ncbi:phage tail tape measure protein [Limnobaculum xujianqingii]|uniref:phage tail tape measure protein n=1 Tax=Limnobaculum xujianqingii TaxID=2738837 RepID=UPI0011269914|nr:phage tail tape measure protein [Limnobaculum xujianqingii]
MTDRKLNIQVAFSALNNMARPVSAARNAAAGLATQIRSTQNSIKSLERQATSFDRLTAASSRTTNELTQAKAKAREMAAAYGPLKGRTTEQVEALKQQRAAIRSLVQQQNQQKNRLGQLRAELYRHGVSVAQGSRATDQIRLRTEQYNRQLAEQQRRLNNVTRSQSQYNRTKELAGKLTSGGMRATMAGAATIAPIVGTVKAYSSLEDSMKGVAKQVDGLRDANGQRTNRFYEMQQAIKGASETLPMLYGANDYAALVEGGARMGVANSNDPWEKQKTDLLTFASTAAMASTAFELPAEQLSESLGKIAGLYSIPIAEIESLGDAINYLDDNAKSKGADIIDALQRMGGFADKLNYQNAAALGSTFLTLGSTAETAASASNAMVRELANAMIQPDKFQSALDTLGLSAQRIEKSMSEDAMGTIIGVLEATSKLAKEKQIPVLTQLFGKEFGDDAAKLANNLPELRRQIELTRGTAAKGSMRRESDINKDSLSAQWMLLKASAVNTFTSLGETLREPLLEAMKSVQDLLKRFRTWIENNKELAGTLMKIGGAIGAALVAFGTLAAGIGAVLGPIASVKLSLSTLLEDTSIGSLLSGFLDVQDLLGGLIGPIQAVGSCLSSVFGPMIGVIAGISAPIWALIAVIVVAAIAVIKFWEPIKAFFSGFFSGLVSGLQPVISAFSWLSPLFDSIGAAIGVVWEWFTKLFEPIHFSAEALDSCTSAGQTFGELVGKALSGLFSVITSVAKGIGWLLEKLGAIPSAADAALHAANAMAPSDLNKQFIEAFGSKNQKKDEPPKSDNKPVTVKLSGPQLGALKGSGKNSSKSGGGGGGNFTNKLEQRDLNKLGDIVFKNVPPYLSLRGGYAEPMVQHGRSAVSPYTVQPPEQKTNSTAGSSAASMPVVSDQYNINIYINDAANLNEENLAKRIRQELEAHQASIDRRRRSSLVDNS